jgi:hypothetical protein
MPTILQDTKIDGIPIVRLESDYLKVEVVPEVGGRVLSLVEKRSGYEFLWRNHTLRLERLLPGSEYDPNFYGGVDELIPNDIPEKINDVDCPDHGELWTTPLSWKVEDERLLLQGKLPKFGLRYEREMSLRRDRSCLDFTYRISNESGRTREFLWKLHAALAIQPGDIIHCPARKGQVVDLAWSRHKTLAPFDWPMIEGEAANVIPAADGTVDFYYLFELSSGIIGWKRPSHGLSFAYEFNPKVFPCAWLFASYGGFRGHYTVVLEPCTAMPLSVNDAAAKNQCSRLEPGQTLETSVTLYAGPLAPKQEIRKA